MRTVTDLREALIACEQPAPSVDQFLAKIPGVTVADEILIEPASVRRRRPALWITAAAVAAAVAVGSVALIGSGARNHAVDDHVAARPFSISQLALPFALGTSGAKIARVGMSDTGDLNVDLDVDGHWLMLTFFARGHAKKDNHLETVDMDGVLGQYGEQWITVEGAAATAAASSGAPVVQTTTPVETKKLIKYVNWTAPDGRSVALKTGPEGDSVSKDELLALARDVDLSATTPMRSPFSLKNAPEGLALAEFDSDVRKFAPGGATISPGWQFGAYYRQLGADPSTGYFISVQSWDDDVSGPAIAKVHGHTAHWRDHVLTVDLGRGAYLHIVDSDRDRTEQQVLAVAKQVSVVSNPADQSTWLNAAKALPLGS